MVEKKVRITNPLFSMVTGTIEVGAELVLRQVESEAWQISEPLAWRGVVIPEDCFEELPEDEYIKNIGGNPLKED